MTIKSSTTAAGSQHRGKDRHVRKRMKLIHPSWLLDHDRPPIKAWPLPRMEILR